MWSVKGEPYNWGSVANQPCSTELDPVRSGSENEINAKLSDKYDTKRGLLGPMSSSGYTWIRSAEIHQR